MINVNDAFRTLGQNYLFSEVAARLKSFSAKHPEARIIRMDIGDVTRPIPEAALTAMHAAVDEMASTDTFHGYGPEQGYSFLREAIATHDYRSRGLEIDADDIFISDGAKSDIGNLGDILPPQAVIALPDPGYPVYYDANAINGRTRFVSLNATPENGFVPSLPQERPDVIYMCFPNNPTGAALTREGLQQWVDYALANDVLIVYDSAYEAFVRTPGTVRSVYEAAGAERCAIEVRSFSKTAGFTGLRCGYTVVPTQLKGIFSDGTETEIRRLWNRRQCTKFNGASYIIQRGAAALYSPEGRRQTKELADVYLRNAAIIRSGLSDIGIKAYGGVDSPYIWAQCPAGLSSWETFDFLLNEAGVSTTPGSGFGNKGEGFLRLTAFNTEANTREAMTRLASLRK